MAPGHIESFLAKSWEERYHTAQFYVRQGLAKLPYVPVPVSLAISPNETVEFWWSRVVPYYDANRGFNDYWGHDAGDLRFLWRVLERGMTFIDIGANEGVYSLVAGKKLERTGTVIAFEPSPREFERLSLHFRWNGMPRAKKEPLALGAASGRSVFFEVADGDTSRNGLRRPASSDPFHQIAVETTTLDEYVERNGIPRVDVIKLDVEGGEFDVFRGASATLVQLRPILICEVLDAATEPWGYPAREIIATLEAHDYEWFDVNGDGALARHTTQNEYPAIENYVAVPCEKVSSLPREILR